MQVQGINYFTTNNYPVKSTHNQKQSPAFGKLIIDEEMPAEILKSITKSDEIKKLVKMLHNVGTDLRISGPKYPRFDLDRYIVLDAGERYQCEAVKYFGGTDSKIAKEIDSLKSGFAEEAFNKYIEYIKEKAAKEAFEKNRANYIKDIDSFNKTLKMADAPKPKWWQFWKR